MYYIKEIKYILTRPVDNIIKQSIELGQKILPIWELFFASQFLWPQHFLHGIHALYNNEIRNYFINY